MATPSAKPRPPGRPASPAGSPALREPVAEDSRRISGRRRLTYSWLLASRRSLSARVRPMIDTVVKNLVDLLRQSRLLPPEQAAQLDQIAGQFSEPRALARE